MRFLRKHGRWVGLAIVLGVAMLWLVVLFQRDSVLPLGTANGVYANGCCGTLVLHNGQLTLGGAARISYVVGEDKVGPYVLPLSFVGVRDGYRLSVERKGVPAQALYRQQFTPRHDSVGGQGAHHLACICAAGRRCSLNRAMLS